ncbi:VOC family protein [Sphaerisporangium viridialbum]|uniref:VOC family protein n=1 Tax=Sphaerisporangium viridialbum TaxID=46189 RepID=UPI003C756286
MTIPDVSLAAVPPAQDAGPPMAPFASLGRTVLLVDDADAALAFYREALGFAVLHDQETDGFRYHDDPGSRSLHFRDPLGNVIVAVQLKGAGR